MKVGFIDHHLNNYHANKFHGILSGEVGQAAGGVEIVAAYESEPEGDDWCAKNGVPRASSAAEVVEKADAILVLAPDNTETHLVLGREALKSGKPVFFDKTLSSTMEDAREIVRLARENKTPIFSSSSLRFSVELEELIERVGDRPMDGIFTHGFAKWRSYAVHSVAPALRLLGGDRVRRVIDSGKGAVRLVTLETASGRRAFIDHRDSENQFEVTPWMAGALVDGKYEIVTVKLFDEFYANLMRQTLKFFQTRESVISMAEYLETVAVEVAAQDSFDAGGVWVDIEAAE